MNFELRHIGSFNGIAAKLLMLKVSTLESSIEVDITNNKCLVDTAFIDELKWLVSELEEHNEKLNEYLTLK